MSGMSEYSGNIHNSIASSSDDNEEFAIEDDDDELLLMPPLPPAQVPEDCGDENVDVWASAIRIIDSNPGRKYRKENDKLRRIKGTIYDDDIGQHHDVIKEQITDWLCLVQGLPHCFDKYHSKFHDCSCIKQVDAPSIVTMLVDFCEQPKFYRDSYFKMGIFIAAVRNNRKKQLNKKRKLEDIPDENKRPPYALAIGLGNSNPRICSYSFRNLYGLFKVNG